jgi:hypothetical protein
MNVTMANKSENPRPQNNPYLATPLALHTTMLVKVTICISIKGDEHHHGHKGGWCYLLANAWITWKGDFVTRAAPTRSKEFNIVGNLAEGSLI